MRHTHLGVALSIVAMAASVAVAGSSDLTTTPNLSGSNITAASESISLTAIDEQLDVAGEGAWFRDTWQSDDDTVRVVQLDIGDLHADVAATSWVETCIDSSNIDLDGQDRTDLPAGIEVINGTNYYVELHTSDACDVFNAGGTCSGPAYDYAGARTLKSGEPVMIPVEFEVPEKLGFVTMGGKNTSGNTLVSYTVQLTWEKADAADIVRNVVIPIRHADDDPGNNNEGRNGAAGSSGTSNGVAFIVKDWDADAFDGKSSDNQSCGNNDDHGDEVIIDNPAIGDAAFDGYGLVSVQFDYDSPTDLTQDHLSGPLALSLWVDSDDYDSAFTYRGTAASPTTQASVVSAGDFAYWYRLTWDISFSDEYSDAFLIVRCGFADGSNAPDFSGALPIDVTPDGMRALTDEVTGEGSVDLDDLACGGDFVEVSVELVSAFDAAEGPELTALNVFYDVDADEDGYTVDGIFLPNNTQQPNLNVTRSTADVADPAVDGDCDDAAIATNPGAVEPVPSLTDLDCDGLVSCVVDGDGDGDGALAGTLSPQPVSVGGAGGTATCIGSGFAPTAGDCRDGDPTWSSTDQGQRLSETPADGADYNCDGSIDCYVDADGDGAGTTTTGSVAVSVGSDNDCDVVTGAFSSTSDDCNDDINAEGASFTPGTTETPGSGKDTNCDSFVTCYEDEDGDGDGAWVSGLSADLAELAVSQAGDSLSCDRSLVDNQALSPAVNVATSSNAADCGPLDDTINTAADEVVGDNIDQDCNDKLSCYIDADGDSQGTDAAVNLLDPATFVEVTGVSCVATGASPTADDCDDSDPLIYHSTDLAVETPGDSVDQNCDGQLLCYRDEDQDGYGSNTFDATDASTYVQLDVLTATTGCDDAANEAATGPEDCQDDPDQDGGLFSPDPLTVELVGDGVDYDCSGSVLCYSDRDGDSEGDPDATVEITVTAGESDSCSVSTGAVGLRRSPNALDCNDSLQDGGDYYSTAPENPGEGIDYDCDGFFPCYTDGDGDGFGDDAGNGTTDNPVAITPGGQGSCDDQNNGIADDDDDCDDGDDTIYPGATEVSGSGVDSNCDGNLQCFYDRDDDGQGSSEVLLVSSDDVTGVLRCDDFGGSGQSGDCKDDPAIYADAGLYNSASNLEAGFGVEADYNCDGLINCFLDADMDGQGNDDEVLNDIVVDPGDTAECRANDSRSTNKLDCNDGDPNTLLSATPEAPGQSIDQNCDGEVVCYVDADDDGFGSNETIRFTGVPGFDGDCAANGSTTNDDCRDCVNWNSVTSSCDDSLAEKADAASVNPGGGQVEVLETGLFDEDCDGTIACFHDRDQDTYGTENFDAADQATWAFSSPAAEPVTNGVGMCLTSELHSANSEDCHDDKPQYFPSATHLVDSETYLELPAGTVSSTAVAVSEIPGNAYDDNCDGVVLCFQDPDQDGWATEPVSPSDAASLKQWSPTALYPSSRELGGVYTCNQDRLEGARPAESDEFGNPKWDCKPNDASINPGATADEENGLGIDNNCDSEVFCFIDFDGDGFGGATRGFTVDYPGYSPAESGIQVCSSDNDFADNGDDCHDNNYYANPDASEVPGHTPSVGEEIEVPGQGSQIAGVTWHYCLGRAIEAGDIAAGETTVDTSLKEHSCYNAAFDDDCQSGVDCFEDQDRDGFGTDVVNVADPSAELFTAFPNPDESDFEQFSCDLTSTSGPSTYAGIGGARDTPWYNPETYDCHDNNDQAHPGLVEVPGADGIEVDGVVRAFDEDCDGTFDCYRDRDQDGYGTDEIVSISRDRYLGLYPRGQVVNGSTFDDGFYDCVLDSNVALVSSGVVPSALHWRGGGAAGVSNTTYDCHDLNSLANPGVSQDAAGNTVDSDGETTRAYDDDCDGVVSCFEDVDIDTFGTYEVDFAEGASTSRVAGTLVRQVEHGWFLCDDLGAQIAGRGGVGQADFDCHDSDSTAKPGATEIPGDAFDNDCDGTVVCFEDLDDDGYGTVTVSRQTNMFPTATAPAFSYTEPFDTDDLIRATEAGMILYVCGSQAATEAGLSTAQADALDLGSDGLAALGGARTEDYDPDGYDCHDDNPDANPGVSAETPGSVLDTLGVERAYDENCDGRFTCFRDRDDDGVGTAEAVDVLREEVTSVDSGANDDGYFTCNLAPASDVPAGATVWTKAGATHLAGVGGGALGDLNFDCHDTNANAKPGATPVAGDSEDSLGQVEFSYDDDCDGFVRCYRDGDDDGYGTYLVVLSHDSTTSSDVAGTIAKESGQDYYDCDNNAQNWAGRGGVDSPADFDCHDRETTVNPGNETASPTEGEDDPDEVFGDAFDNDCDGRYLCYEDLDNDGYGTKVTAATSVGFDHPDFATLNDPNLDPTVGELTATEAGLKLYPCGTAAAQDAGLTVDIDGDANGLLAFLAQDRVAGVGGYEADGVTPSADFDCHDDWEYANPGLSTVDEIAGNPFDDDCDGFFSCWQDRDGDGFGNATSFLSEVQTVLDEDAAGTNVAVLHDYDDFPFASFVGDINTSALPGYPVETFPELADYRLSTNQVERAARADAVSGDWYDCRGILDGSPAGGRGEDFYDCHDEEPTIYPAFTESDGSIFKINPEDRPLVAGPTSQCGGPVMCVIPEPGGNRIENGAYDACTADGGNWRCFEPTSGSTVNANKPTDNGETAGDAFDNDCDGVVLCYENVDGDLVGTVATLDINDDQVSTSYDDGLYVCTGVGEARYTGDCHDSLSLVQPPLPVLNPTTGEPVADGADLTSSEFIDLGDDTLYPVMTEGYDDPACDGVVLCELFNEVADRYAKPECDGALRCYDFDALGEDVESNGLQQVDQNCDGIVACYYDEDQDGYGRDPVADGPGAYRLASLTERLPVLSDQGVRVTSDAGWFICDDAEGRRAPATTAPDCNDANPFENPGGVETLDILAESPLVDAETLVSRRDRAVSAVGNDIDENCDGQILCWVDADNDGWGGGRLPDGVSINDVSAGLLSDTWEGDNTVEWTIVVGSEETACFNPAHDDPEAEGNGLASQFGDCHDDEALANPDADSLPGNTFDNDCDGIWTCYENLDGDEYGSTNIINDDGDRECTVESGESDTNTDCLDDNVLANNVTYPLRYNAGTQAWEYDETMPAEDWVQAARVTSPSGGAPGTQGVEINGDGIDGFCDDVEMCYVDADGDGFMGATGSGADVGQDVLKRPNATEERERVETNVLDGIIPCDPLGEIRYYGWPLSVEAGAGGDSSDPYLRDDGKALFDCNDENDAVYPGAPETYYDGIDQNCDNLSDFDVDGDGYDSREFTGDRPPCPASSGLADIDPVLGCGRGTDCEDAADKADVHPAPYGASETETELIFEQAILQDTQLRAAIEYQGLLSRGETAEDYCPEGSTGLSLEDCWRDVWGADGLDSSSLDDVVLLVEQTRDTVADEDVESVLRGVMVEEWDESDGVDAADLSPLSRHTDESGLSYQGIHGTRESCESAGGEIDSDCDGSPNTYWDCWFDVQGWDAFRRGQYAEAQREKFRPVGAPSRDSLWTSCIEAYEAGSYYVDRTDFLDGDLTAYEDLQTDEERQAFIEELISDEDYIDFEYDPTWTQPAESEGSYYRDSDGDLEGDAKRQGVYLCNVDEEPVNLWRSDRNDCDDTRSTVNALGIEFCDERDNNCNGQVDEATLDITPENDAKCRMHFVDADGDSWGLQEDDVFAPTDSYCLCETFENNGDLQEPATCPHYDPDDLYDEEGVLQVKYGHLIGGSCYVKNASDCDDLNSVIKPPDPETPGFEKIDGVDNDCDGALPLIELDCDDDNAFPYLPKMTQALLDDPENTEIFHAEDVGLAACSAGAPPSVLCWGERLPLSCDDETGFWTVSTGALEGFEKFSGAARVPRTSDCVKWDCDDQCPSRCGGLDESCDGLDNDCAGYEDEALSLKLTDEGYEDYSDRLMLVEDFDGVPDVMDVNYTQLGYVQQAELDQDADLYVTCNPNFQGNDNQVALTTRECRGYSLYNDLNDLCVLTGEVVEEEFCNGFAVTVANTTVGNPDNIDDVDGDGYRTCGASGIDRAAADSVYVLVFSQGDIDVYNEDPDDNRLEKVVPLIPPRFYDEDNFKDTSVAGQVRECDADLMGSIDGLLQSYAVGNAAVSDTTDPSADEDSGDAEDDSSDSPADTDSTADASTDASEIVESVLQGLDPVERRERMLELCILADTCRLESEQRNSSESYEDANNNDDAVDGSLLPSPPLTGINQSSDYCEYFQNARCSVVELTVGVNADDALYDTPSKSQVESGELPVGDGYLPDNCLVDLETGGLTHPEQAVVRTVWSREQIVEARKLVVDFECYRTWGTFGCESERFSYEIDGYPSWQSPYQGVVPQSGGYFPLPDVPDTVYKDNPQWWLHMNRFSPTTFKKEGTLVGCWGDPTLGENGVADAETIEVVGGDCIEVTEPKSTKVSPAQAHRGISEGPGDLLARYQGELVDCATCQDGIDNNCNQLTDKDEPACDQCFVGQGSGCGCSSTTDMSRLGATTTPMLMLWMMLTVFVRRRETP